MLSINLNYHTEYYDRFLLCRLKLMTVENMADFTKTRHILAVLILIVTLSSIRLKQAVTKNKKYVNYL